MKYQTKPIALSSPDKRDAQCRTRNPVDNQDGSVMLLALMIMAVMMVIAVASSDTVVSENFIIRNSAIHKENVNLVESALMNGLQRFMQIPQNIPENFDPDASNSDWISPRTAAFANARWYNRGNVETLLDANNSADANVGNVLNTLTTRGEAGNGVLRYAVVGWAPRLIAGGGSESIVVGPKPIWHMGRILGEYVSADAGGADNGNGFLRMELGLQQQW